MELKQALEILSQVAILAQSRGLFNLDEAVAVKQAVDVSNKTISELTGKSDVKPSNTLEDGSK